MLRKLTAVGRAGFAAALTTISGLAAFAGGSLGLPVTDAWGDPIDVGLLVLGHSTSVRGDWPDKFARTLNQDPLDGRNYVVLRATTGGDGGFLWSQLQFKASDPQYARVKGSEIGQSCQDNSGTRWSCRRLRLQRALTGREPAPPECAPPANGCVPTTIGLCVWHDKGQRFEEPNASFKSCWDRMDVRLALIQDTTNRSWPVDDNTRDGFIGTTDYFLASDINAMGRPCPVGSGTIGLWIDWDCDGALGAADASAGRYADWLQRLTGDLLDGFGPDGVDHVFLTHKPIEMEGCQYYPGEPCSRHGLRTPTPARPFDHYYLPPVYWELRSFEDLFSRPNLDPRVHWATPLDHGLMWDRSARCYEDGIGASDWTIPLSAGRPSTIAADDTENDGLNAETVGCLSADHIHHNENGGWMMADAWYEGMRPYLSDLGGAPSEASGGGTRNSPLRVTGYDPATGLLDVSYGPACGAIDHAVHAGPLANVSAYAYDRSTCELGSGGQAQVDVGPGNRFFVLGGRDGYAEGSLGADSRGVERPAPAPGGPCYLPQRLGGSCP